MDDAQQQAINRQRDLDTDAANKKATYNQILSDTMAGGRNMVNSYAAQIGVDPTKISSYIDQIVQDTGSSIPRGLQWDDSGSLNPASYYSAASLAPQFDAAQSRARQANTAQVRNAFAPGYSSSLLPDSSIDSIVNDIIGEQRGLANTNLDYQTKRGLLNPQGRAQADTALAGQDAAARSTVGGIGRSVLGKDRASLDDIIGSANDAASSWMFGNDAFSVDPYKQRLSDTAARESGALSGDIRSALGGTKLFDLSNIISQGGEAQGAQNLTTASPVVPGERKKTTASRGVGSVGSF
jgi:hypothetical protein